MNTAVRYVLALLACFGLCIVYLFVVGLIRQAGVDFTHLGAIPAIIFIVLPFVAFLYAVRKTWKAVVDVKRM